MEGAAYDSVVCLVLSRQVRRCFCVSVPLLRKPLLSSELKRKKLHIKYYINIEINFRKGQIVREPEHVTFTCIYSESWYMASRPCGTWLQAINPHGKLHSLEGICLSSNDLCWTTCIVPLLFNDDHFTSITPPPLIVLPCVLSALLLSHSLGGYFSRAKSKCAWLASSTRLARACIPTTGEW